jgi:signal transduction histidine kinase
MQLDISFLEELHPIHFIMNSDGALLDSSNAVRDLFPHASSIGDLFATNSSDELLRLVQTMKVNQQRSAKLDLFSIQHYAIWDSTIIALENFEGWLICKHEKTSKEKNQLSPAEIDNEELAALRQRNEFYEELLHHLPAEVAVFNPEFKFLFVNRSAIKNEELRKWLMGRSEIEYWKSKNLPLDKALNRIHAFKESIAARALNSVEEIFHPGTENEKHYIRVTNPYFDGDNLKFLLTYGVDITSLKKIENQLIHQNTELEKVNNELDQFVYSASHNLRAPLLSMKGLLNLMSQEDSTDSDKERFLKEVYKSIDRLDATIHDIIEYSKNARLEILAKPVDALQLIHAAADDLKFYNQNAVDIQISTDITSTLYSDERRLKSIIHNVISNAIKYADPSKAVCRVEVALTVTREHCKIEFSDNGIGIAAEHQDRVFQMFFRATSQRSGSGLGLYIVKEMVQKLGGKISLTSQPTVGTNVIIEFPNLA